MKRLMFAFIACVAAIITGCKPDEGLTPETSYSAGIRIGATAGALVSAQRYEAKITDKSLEVVDLVVGLAPGEGQTFKDVWAPKIEEFLGKQEGMSDLTKIGVNLIATVLITALDKEVVKHPEILKQKYIAAKLLVGVAEGYKTYVKPSNFSNEVGVRYAIDGALYREMEQWFKQK